MGAKKFDPATMCCPHLKSQHRSIGCKPCGVDGCACATYWRQPAMTQRPRARKAARGHGIGS